MIVIWLFMLSVDAQMDGEEDVDIWAEPEDSRKNILRKEDENGKSVIRAANLNKLVQVPKKTIELFCTTCTHQAILGAHTWSWEGPWCSLP